MDEGVFFGEGDLPAQAPVAFIEEGIGRAVLADGGVAVDLDVAFGVTDADAAEGRNDLVDRAVIVKGKVVGVDTTPVAVFGGEVLVVIKENPLALVFHEGALVGPAGLQSGVRGLHGLGKDGGRLQLVHDDALVGIRALGVVGGGVFEQFGAFGVGVGHVIDALALEGEGAFDEAFGAGVWERFHQLGLFRHFEHVVLELGDEEIVHGIDEVGGVVLGVEQDGRIDGRGNVGNVVGLDLVRAFGFIGDGHADALDALLSPATPCGGRFGGFGIGGKVEVVFAVFENEVRGPHAVVLGGPGDVLLIHDDAVVFPVEEVVGGVDVVVGHDEAPADARGRQDVVGVDEVDFAVEVASGGVGGELVKEEGVVGAGGGGGEGKDAGSQGQKKRVTVLHLHVPQKRIGDIMEAKFWTFLSSTGPGLFSSNHFFGEILNTDAMALGAFSGNEMVRPVLSRVKGSGSTEPTSSTRPTSPG